MIRRLRNAFLNLTEPPRRPAIRFDRPLVLFQSDDWGRAGVRDREGWEQLRAAGLNLGEKPYDFYSLETADDVKELAALLSEHRDSTGRKPSIVMNFIMANVDFDRCFERDLKQIPLRPLTEGVPGAWKRPGLLEAYREGVREGLFYPALHGLTHLCERAVLREFHGDEERGELIRTMWKAQTPYIHWRMPWIGYEYWDPNVRPARRSLPVEDQRSAIDRATAIFSELFGIGPFSACAPGYRANADTRTIWFENGVRVAQNGPGESRFPFIDANGMLHTFRTVEIEPAIESCEVATLLAKVNECFETGCPAVISSHSINFHSTIRDFRTPMLKLLGEFLTELERKWPDLLYIHDQDLYSVVTKGFYPLANAKIQVGTTTGGAGD